MRFCLAMFGNPNSKRMRAYMKEVFLTLILYDIMWICVIFMNIYLIGIMAGV